MEAVNPTGKLEGMFYNYDYHVILYTQTHAISRQQLRAIISSCQVPRRRVYAIVSRILFLFLIALFSFENISCRTRLENVGLPEKMTSPERYRTLFRRDKKKRAPTRTHTYTHVCTRANPRSLLIFIFLSSLFHELCVFPWSSRVGEKFRNIPLKSGIQPVLLREISFPLFPSREPSTSTFLYDVGQVEAEIRNRFFRDRN